MDSVDDALHHLKSSVAQSQLEGRDKKRLADTAAQISTHLVLLKLSPISEQIAENLRSFLRESLRVLYAILPTPSLRLAATIFEAVYHERIFSAITSGQHEQKNRWMSVLYALLSGVLDYLDEHASADAKEAIGQTLFPVLSDICVSLSAPRTGVDLRYTVRPHI
ncbi:uncharacterized protein BXZ73DRAFT_44898 [Epithele typhae]|uniref:uncharacterized protein n=1 Tax=Epithele typhae TaxID=378194 RepID=UPI00200731C1|nr:uncharacterized protein BXZ73DRAFT_44898 [Epithele typhae]KAH9936855.1 hypothetical protein BXZ73DRAFT_44898 [Epithele typhae]